MAKKRSWFNLVKRFFISDAETKPEKKEKRRKWVFFGKFKIKRRLPSIAAPPASPPKEAITAAESLHKEGQSKSALDVALASAAAAEAAIAAAHLAAEVVWLSTGVSQSNHQCQKETEQLHQGSTVEDQAAKITHSDQDDMIKIQELAAVKIQTAFRAYLAKKALRALKGIVKLQAIIRGRNVRRQAINTLKCLQSIVNIQSQVQARRIRVAGDENWQLQNLRDKIIKMDANSPKRWDGSILTKEESEAVYLSKKEAAIKRERIKEYAFSHRNSAETDRSKMNGRFQYWLEQWVDNQVAKSKELEDLDTVVTSNPKPRVEYKGKPLKLKTLPKQYHIEGLDSPTAAPTRSFHRKQPSLGEDNNSPFSGSPVVPTYMATTESTKAKARSMSSPKLRPGSFDAYSDSYSPCKNRLPLMTSTTSTQIASNVRVTRASVYQQRSPSFKGVPSPVKSCRTLKDLSIDSECSFRTWDPHSTFR